MSSIENVHHISLMQVYREGWARFVIAHKILTDRGTEFRHRMINGIPVGSFIIVTFRTTPSRRTFVSVLSTLPTGTNNPIKTFLTGKNVMSRLVKANNRCTDLFGDEWNDVKRIQEMQNAIDKDVFTEFENLYNASISGDEKAPERMSFSVEDAEEIKSQWLRNIYVTAEQLQAMVASLKLSKAKSYANILLTGASGYGKTSIPRAFADMNGMDYFRINCAQVRDPNEFFGYREAEDGSTLFVKSEFSEAVSKGNCVVVLDELNRLEPWLHNALFPILDDDRKTVIHNEIIEVGENTIIMATVNEGYEYTGTFVLDQALRNRMDITLVVEPLPEQIEAEAVQRQTNVTLEQAAKVVKVIRGAREVAKDKELQIDVSTRSSLKVAKLVSADVSLQDAFFMVVSNNLEMSDRKTMLDEIMPVLSTISSS